MTARALWECPECGTRMTSEAQAPDVARDGLAQVIREHLESIHPTSADLTNAATQASGWLSPAGHLVTLWGGPDDGLEVWLPPGELPPVIGIIHGVDGKPYPLRSALARALAGVTPYRLGSPEAAVAAGRRPRYLHDGRAQ